MTGYIDSWMMKKVQREKKRITVEDDDEFWILIGDTGSGKSTLGKHIMTEYLGDKVSIDRLGLDREQFSKIPAQEAQRPKGERVVFYDEANVSSRDALTKWNKSLIDLYYSIRGLNMFHLWCNPTLEWIDKPFVRERVKAVIFCFKVPRYEKKGVRFYYFFKKSAVLEILDKFGRLTHDVLFAQRKKSSHTGWFKNYEGPLDEAYDSMKNERMIKKTADFAKSWEEAESRGPGRPSKGEDALDHALRKHLIEESAYAPGVTVRLAEIHNVSPQTVRFRRAKMQQKMGLISEKKILH